MKAAALVLLLAAAAPPGGPIQFEDVTARAGLRFVANGSPTDNKNQPETMVAGVGLLDYDNDGFLDVYFVNGARIPSLKKDGPEFWNRLFHNNRDGTFTDVTERAGVAGEGFGTGVAIGDYDNDGWPDIYVCNTGRNQLFRNNHDGTFTDVTDKAGVGGPLYDGRKMWSTSAAWLDYNNDGLPDLFVSNYIKWEVDKDPNCGPRPGIRAYCHPKNYDPLPDTLFRNNGDGTFTDVSAESGILKHLGKGMGVAIADYDGDGFIDVFVANDNFPNFLFHNIAGKRFEEVALQSGVAYAESSNVISGMGADFKDVDNDGRPDLWHTAIENETFPLFLNTKQGFFDATSTSGLAATVHMSGWSAGMFDFDNDGWKDLFVSRSNVMDNIALWQSRKYEEANSVFRNLGKGRFQEVSARSGGSFQVVAAYRGAAFGDIDNDGRVDAVVTVLNEPAKVFRNVSPGDNHWLLLKLVGTKSTRMSVGARIRLTAEDGSVQYNHVTTATGFASASDSRVHFGLGRSKAAREIEIVWPSRIRQTLRNVPADRLLTIEESSN